MGTKLPGVSVESFLQYVKKKPRQINPSRRNGTVCDLGWLFFFGEKERRGEGGVRIYLLEKGDGSGRRIDGCGWRGWWLVRSCAMGSSPTKVYIMRTSHPL